jgi:ribosome-associated protein
MNKNENHTMKTLNAIAQAIYDKKGYNILALDVRNISTLADYFVIAEGNVSRHVKALSSSIQEDLKKHQLHPYYIEGEKDSDWVVLDYGDIVIHLMVPEMREKYTLEQLWKKSKVVDVNIDLGKEKA